MVRGRVQEFIQEVLEEEVTEFLGGWAKSQRRASVEGGRRGYRNGYGKPRNLTLASGTVEVCRPRVRDVEERFESRVLPLFARRTKEAAELVVQLYLHGLAEGDFELALRSLLGGEEFLGRKAGAGSCPVENGGKGGGGGDGIEARGKVRHGTPTIICFGKRWPPWTSNRLPVRLGLSSGRSTVGTSVLHFSRWEG